MTMSLNLKVCWGRALLRPMTCWMKRSGCKHLLEQYLWPAGKQNVTLLVRGDRQSSHCDSHGMAVCSAPGWMAHVFSEVECGCGPGL
jgi:hypothetical protein